MKKTPLYDFHQRHGGKIVDFAGYALPVQYDKGIISEHLHTRNGASLFDISHMGHLFLDTDHSTSSLEYIMPIDLNILPVGRGTISFFTSVDGGIRDDLMIAQIPAKKRSQCFYMVVNASQKHNDYAHLELFFKKEELTILDDRALVALQGPKAEKVLREVFPNFTEEMFYLDVRILGLDFGANTGEDYIIISRSGYTGEDGFEISLPNNKAEAIVEKIVSHPDAAPAGLGARDSLRLECGLCLHGHDIDRKTTPVEARLEGLMKKRRKENGGFIGHSVIQRQMKYGTERVRVGLFPEGRSPIREGVELLSERGESVGRITSGTFSPTLQRPISMGYINTEYAEPGTKVVALLRGSPVNMIVTTLPFVPLRFKRKVVR